jgi:putative transposase
MSRIARRVKQAGVYFVTTDTWQRHQLFQKAELARIVLVQIFECGKRGFCKLHAFVLMPEHLHMLITPAEEASLEKALTMIQGGSSFRIAKELNYQFPIWISGHHDRWIGNTAKHRISKQYLELNPVKAQLAEKPSDYSAGAASGKYEMDPCGFDEGSFRG